MTFIKSMASYYRRNRHLIGHNTFQSPRLHPIVTSHSEPLQKMESKSASTNSEPSSPPPPPPRFHFYTWAKWALGSILTIVLPFWDKRWRSLLRLEGEVEIVAAAVENVAEVVEKVATVTEKMAADAAQSLPKDGKLKGAAIIVENVSKEVAEEAHLTQDIIHKVEELKQEVEMLIDPIKEREKLEESHKI